MPITPPILKQIKSDTLTSLHLQGQPLDEHDWKILNNYIRTTRTLRELDLSGMWGSMEVLAESLKQNVSVKKLGLGQIVQDQNMSALIDLLKGNPAITELSLDNCYGIQNGGVAGLSRFLKTHPTITHLTMAGVNPDRETNTPQLEKIIAVLKTSANILYFAPDTDDEVEAVCTANRAAVVKLIDQAFRKPESLSVEDIQGIKTRLSAFLHVAETETALDKNGVVKLLLNIEDVAGTLGVDFAMPQQYAAAAADLPRPFHPSDDKVDFSRLTALPPAETYRAVAAGQVDALLTSLQQLGQKLTAGDYLFKPEGQRENTIELVARQGKLADVMTAALWTGDPRGFKQVAEAVPAREWRRQMRDTPIEKLLSQINAASFKKAHRPQMRFG